MRLHIWYNVIVLVLLVALIYVIEKKNDKQNSTVNPLCGYPEDSSKKERRMTDWLDNQTKLLANVRRVCVNNGHDSRNVMALNRIKANRHRMGQLIVDEKHHTLYCITAKVGNTNWKRVFALLTGLANATNPLDLAREYVHGRVPFTYLNSGKFSTEQVKNILETYTKFMFVRDPMERIVSAFRDKMEGKNAQFGALANKIHEEYKDNKSGESSENKLISFPEFLRYIYHEKFVEKSNLDVHWRTFQDACFPCQIHYDYIGKYENLQEDANNILERIGAPEHIKFPPFKASLTQHLMPDYTDSLTDTELENFHEVYKLDYEVFGYDFTKYQKKIETE